jgi:hypothetical protein
MSASTWRRRRIRRPATTIRAMSSAANATPIGLDEGPYDGRVGGTLLWLVHACHDG